MRSLPELVARAVAEHSELPCLLTKTKGRLETKDYAWFGDRVQAAACGLLAAGVAPGERVVVIAENCPEWLEADVGILSCGAVNVPLYPSLPPAQIQPLVERVGARFAIVDDEQQLARLDAVADQLPQLERVYVFEAEKLPEDHPRARPWSELMAAGEQRREELLPVVAERTSALTPDDIATIIFTSGTTGVPKGAMLTHGNLVSNVLASARRIDIRARDTMVTFLPLCHVFQRTVTYIGLHAGGASLFNESLRALLPNLLAVRPAVMIVVPRFLQMIRDRVVDGIAQQTGLAGTIATWAMEVAEQLGRCKAEGRSPSPWLKLQQGLAEKRVFSAIREQLGLEQCRFLVSGGAGLPPDIGAWFYGIGLRAVMGYGLTETSPVVAVSDPQGAYRFDAIGFPIDDVEVKLAPDGELLVRGPNVMVGYLDMPTETAEAIEPDGWFHTGDIADFAPDGQLRITDRKKNILVLANGKNVAPAGIEGTLLNSPLIERVMLLGDHQQVVTALVVPAFDALRRALEQQGEELSDYEGNAWVSLPAAHKLVRTEIDRLSTGLAPFEKVRKFTLLERDFSADEDEVTPTMKLRRNQIKEHFAAEIGNMAGDS